MKHGQYNLIRVGLICGTLLFSTTGCGSKTVDCEIEGKHVHLYVSESNLLSRYIESERERIKGLNRTDEYLPLTEELAQASENGLYPVEENLDYITTKIDSYSPKREAYVYDYIYGSYYGYGFSSGKYEYGLQYGYHWDHEWQEIPLNEYTEDQVRDITYQYQFYKIDKEGVSSKLFDSLEEVPDEYRYFIPFTLIKKNVSEAYYLDKEKQKVK